jgi:hypothetical protein
MFRRRFLAEAGYYRTDLMPSEDSEYFFRILLRNPKITFTDECLMLYRLHSINKITQNEGVAQSRRIVDWARYLSLVISHVESVSLPMDLATRWLFLAGVRKHLKYLRAVPGDHSALVELLLRQVAKMPEPWLSAVDLGMRLTEQTRLRLHGSRWMKAYQADAPTAEQMKLIGDLGFEIASN